MEIGCRRKTGLKIAGNKNQHKTNTELLAIATEQNDESIRL
jgi:hypothetical protein